MSTETHDARPRAYYPEGLNARPRRTATPGWDMGPERQIDDGRTLARALALFSIGLGIFQVAAPGRLTKFLALDDDYDGLVRLYGGREIAHGLAILAERTPTAGVWSRVGGDVLDLATLGLAAAREEPRRDRVLMAGVMVAGVAVLDAICATQLSRRSDGAAARRGR